MPMTAEDVDSDEEQENAPRSLSVNGANTAHNSGAKASTTDTTHTSAHPSASTNTSAKAHSASASLLDDLFRAEAPAYLAGATGEMDLETAMATLKKFQAQQPPKFGAADGGQAGDVDPSLLFNRQGGQVLAKHARSLGASLSAAEAHLKGYRDLAMGPAQAPAAQTVPVQAAAA
eukprot:CAMPEP_0173195398 /NCGR_PEP_ID=MMETSP1141-20130122/15031_1 /TAXON_ID=483371 /ORGANISM="non described non described, Strain CCMP2298" /LENGTH=174 /DNA_ID=CAMNT_0014119919 /DNA_START=84 /DNA_END=605 /DNA_ORIENTATION=-